MMVVTKKKIQVIYNYNGQFENIFNNSDLDQREGYFRITDQNRNTHIYSNSTFGYLIEFDGTEAVDKNDN